MRLQNLPFWIFTLIAVTGCGDYHFPEKQKLESLRVLALVADKPEADPGDTVTITPYLSDLPGKGRKLNFSAEACWAGDFARGDEVSCQGRPMSQTLAVKQEVQGLAAPDYTGSTGTFTLSLPPAEQIFALRSEADRYNGIEYWVIYTVTADDGTSFKAFKRVFVSSKTVKNQNPVLSVFLVAGVPLSNTLPSGVQSLVPSYLEGSGPENYLFQGESGVRAPTDETIWVSWYISDGELSLASTRELESVEFTPPDAKPSDHPVVLVGVARDTRGGESVLIQKW